MRASLSRSIRRLPLIGATAAVVIGASGCFTGPRPTLTDSAGSSGDPAVDAVLARLEQAREALFTIDYQVLTRFGNVTRTAGVVQAGPARRSITVGDVRFIIDNDETATCDLASGACSNTIDAARISDTQLSPDFYASSAAIRLRRDAAARVGPTVGSTTTIGGVPAVCVDVPVTNATETYCALDAGPLARLDAADVDIELTAYAPTPDESRFARNGA